MQPGREGHKAWVNKVGHFIGKSYASHVEKQLIAFYADRHLLEGPAEEAGMPW